MRLRASLLTRLPILFTVALLATAIIGPATASAQPTQVVLDASNQSYFNTLGPASSWNNLFVRGTNGKVIVISMDVDSSNGNMGNGITFDVWRVNDGGWVGRGVPIQNDPGRSKAFVAVRTANATGLLLQIVPTNYTGRPTPTTISTVWDAVPASADPAQAPVFGAGGLMACDAGVCSVTADGAGRWMAGTIGGGAALSPKFGYYLVNQPPAFMPTTTTFVATNSARPLNLSTGGNTPSGSVSSFGFTLRSSQKILSCLGSGAELASFSGGNAASRPGTIVPCQTAESLPNGSPYGAVAKPYSPVAAAVTTYNGSATTGGQYGLELANYKAAGASGNVDYAIYLEYKPVKTVRIG